MPINFLGMHTKTDTSMQVFVVMSVTRKTDFYVHYFYTMFSMLTILLDVHTR